MTTVLVVDDEPDIRMLLRMMLEPTGVDVIEASNGEDCLARVDAGGVDVMVLDLLMPGMDGFAVLEGLRGRGLIDALPVLVLSAHADQTSAREALQAGCVGYINKPFATAEVLAALAEAVGRTQGS